MYTISGRQQAVIQEGERQGEARYRQCFPKMQKRWTVKKVFEKKKYNFLPELQKNVLEMCSGIGNIPDPVPEVELPANIATTPAPNKQDLIDKHRSRFNR